VPGAFSRLACAMFRIDRPEYTTDDGCNSEINLRLHLADSLRTSQPATEHHRHDEHQNYSRCEWVVTKQSFVEVVH
jgi:hypothetical protein